MEINDCIEGQIETLAYGGEGVLRAKGFVVFIPFTAPKDLITARITEVKKSFAKGTVVTIKKGGPNRTIPPCPYFGTCGGCQIQHLNDQEQNTYKLESVRDALKRIGHLHVNSISFVPAQTKWAYRRHITLHLKPHQDTFEAGYIGVDNSSLIVINTCPIFNEKQDVVIRQLQNVVSQIPNPSKQSGRVTLLKATENRYILYFQFESDFPQLNDSIFNNILQHNPLFTGILVSRGKKIESFGDPFTEIIQDDLIFRISPQTFIQNHPEQSSHIYRQICDLMKGSETRRILDLYCGFGMTSLLLAKQGHKVTGIECNGEAIKFAKESNHRNALHAQFILGDVNKLVSKIGKELHPQAILVNPPRTGLSKEVISNLLKIQPEDIIYVSCMPATLARDLALLCKDCYRIHTCTVYDMFPQTAHVETVVHLMKII